MGTERDCVGIEADNQGGRDRGSGDRGRDGEIQGVRIEADRWEEDMEGVGIEADRQGGRDRGSGDRGR